MPAPSSWYDLRSRRLGRRRACTSVPTGRDVIWPTTSPVGRRGLAVDRDDVVAWAQLTVGGHTLPTESTVTSIASKPAWSRPATIAAGLRVQHLAGSSAARSCGDSSSG